MLNTFTHPRSHYLCVNCGKDTVFDPVTLQCTHCENPISAGDIAGFGLIDHTQSEFEPWCVQAEDEADAEQKFRDSLGTLAFCSNDNCEKGFIAEDAQSVEGAIVCPCCKTWTNPFYITGEVNPNGSLVFEQLPLSAEAQKIMFGDKDPDWEEKQFSGSTVYTLEENSQRSNDSSMGGDKPFYKEPWFLVVGGFSLFLVFALVFWPRGGGQQSQPVVAPVQRPVPVLVQPVQPPPVLVVPVQPRPDLVIIDNGNSNYQLQEQNRLLREQNRLRQQQINQQRQSDTVIIVPRSTTRETERAVPVAPLVLPTPKETTPPLVRNSETTAPKVTVPKPEVKAATPPVLQSKPTITNGIAPSLIKRVDPTTTRGVNLPSRNTARSNYPSNVGSTRTQSLGTTNLPSRSRR
jgi:hypothetical protein